MKGQGYIKLRESPVYVADVVKILSVVSPTVTHIWLASVIVAALFWLSAAGICEAIVLRSFSKRKVFPLAG